jgi:hypothetical protein
VNNALAGTIPSEIGDLTKLTGLELGKCAFSNCVSYKWTDRNFLNKVTFDGFRFSISQGLTH